MKTFQNFNEDIEKRRAEARKRSIQATQSARERVEAYQKAQKKKAQEFFVKRQKEKDDEELVQKTTERVKRELNDT